MKPSKPKSKPEREMEGEGREKRERESVSEHWDLDTASVSQLQEFWERVVVDKGVGVGVGSADAYCNGPKAETQTVMGDLCLCGDGKHMCA